SHRAIRFAALDTSLDCVRMRAQTIGWVRGQSGSQTTASSPPGYVTAFARNLPVAVRKTKSRFANCLKILAPRAGIGSPHRHQILLKYQSFLPCRFRLCIELGSQCVYRYRKFDKPARGLRQGRQADFPPWRGVTLAHSAAWTRLTRWPR